MFMIKLFKNTVLVAIVALGIFAITAPALSRTAEQAAAKAEEEGDVEVAEEYDPEKVPEQAEVEKE